MSVSVQVILSSADVTPPEYKTSGASGFDLCALKDYTIPAGGVSLIGTGLFMAVPDGYELQVRSRSGLALKNKVIVLNSPGTVDADYRGEIGVILANLGPTEFNVLKGDRIAQGVLCPVEKALFVPVQELPTSKRGSGGFGSTGL
jgi:dUTP pyrophosphatase